MSSTWLQVFLSCIMMFTRLTWFLPLGDECQNKELITQPYLLRAS